MNPSADMPFRRVPAGQALVWWGEGWKSFLRAPLPWTGMSLAMLVLLLVLRALPLGGLLSQWLSLPLFALGVVFAAFLHKRWIQARTITPQGIPVEPEVEGTFSESAQYWKTRIGPLLLVSVLVLVLGGAFGAVLVLGLGALFGVGLASMGALSHLMTPGAGMMAGVGAMAGGMFTLMLLALLAIFLVSVAFWFVNTLVVLGGVQPWDAIRLSFKAGFANFGAIMLFTLLLIPIGFVAMIPFGLGLLVLLPVISGASYASYQDVFGTPIQPGAATNQPPSYAS
ncbi:hypothetical protein GALL_312220 [mine drainage metagenome]|uniref:Transmembrane protein n=1 Tax=mine drainage metagenome TaxID=410659 RepID=A0A1J5QTH1_9ZZZZ